MTASEAANEALKQLRDAVASSKATIDRASAAALDFELAVLVYNEGRN